MTDTCEGVVEALSALVLLSKNGKFTQPGQTGVEVWTPSGQVPSTTRPPDGTKNGAGW